MGKIEDLEKQLIEAKKQKVEKQIEEELQRLTLVGKCYSTHKLNRYMTSKPSYIFEVQHFINKEHQESGYGSNYRYIVDRLRVYKDGSTFNIERNIVSISSHDIQTKYEITLEQFNHVVNTVIPDCETSIDNLRFAFKYDDYVSFGDSGLDKNKSALLNSQRIEYIDLETLPEKIKEKGLSNISILEILRWCSHPYVYNTYLYKSSNWLEMIVKIRNDLNTSASSWGGSIMERDYPRIQILDKFIEYCKIL